MGTPLVFIDFRVAEIDLFLLDMSSGKEVAIINAASDGLDQIDYQSAGAIRNR